MMSSEEDTECFGLYDKLLINTSNSKKGLLSAGCISLNISNSNSNSSSSSNISNNSIGGNNKRNRQRVDAGEPRNSYSSIPNFSSRPSTFMSSSSAGASGLYGALLNQTQSAHFVGGLFGPNGFGSAKMLNELFGRQVKQAQDATSGLPTSLVDNAMLAAAMETATSADLLSTNLNASLNPSKLLNNNSITNNSANTSDVINAADNTLNNNINDSTSSNSSPAVTTANRRTSCSERSDTGVVASPQPPPTCNLQQQQNDLAHHMLRNILQGKKDLMTLDQELRSVINQHHNNTNLNLNCGGGSGGGSGNETIVSSDSENCTTKNKNSGSGVQSNNNNNIGSSNRNLGNNGELRLNTTAASGNIKVSSNLNTRTANNTTSCKNTSGIHLSSLGAGNEIKIKSEPNSTLISVNAPSRSNNSENSCNNISGRRKSLELKDNSDAVVCLSEEVESEEQHSAETGDHNSIELNQVQNHQQTNSESLLTIDNIVTKKEADDILDDELMVLNSRSDIESLGSPGNSEVNDVMLDSAKDELEEEFEKDVHMTRNKCVGSIKPVVLDMKRARVENIVSSMRSSPSAHHQSNHQVNGCKKRKLYQPQQHAMDGYTASGINFGLNMQSLIVEEEEDDEIESPQIQQKRVEKNALKSQLRSMQEQLAEMQQKYVQLCSRMEQESECQEIDDTASDSLEQDDNPGDMSPTVSLTESTQLKNQRTTSTSPPLFQIKENKLANLGAAVGSTPHMLSQMMNKMMTSKLHTSIGRHSQIHHSFSQQLPLLQDISNVPADHPNSNMPHSAISNAAAMYLGQQFILEQEARIAKEVCEQHERQHQQQQKQQQSQSVMQQQQHHQKTHQEKQQQEDQRRFELQLEEDNRQKDQKLQQQRLHTNHVQQQHHQQSQVGGRQIGVPSNSASSNHSTISQAQRSQQQRSPHLNSSMQSTIKSEISEKFNMLRAHSSSMVRMSGSDLEGLADVLKSEITTSLSALVDTIVTRFVHQRRLFNKQSQSVAAAAEQLNKDLLMASQILDRKSPRTKIADQSISNTLSVGSSLLNTTGNNTAGNQSAIFQTPKAPHAINPVAAAALYNSISGLGGNVSGSHTNQLNPFCIPEPRDQNMEQNEALSLVVTPKKKRHKVTDTRITPRTVSRILAQDGTVTPSTSGSNMVLDSNNGQNSTVQHNKYLNQTPVSSCSNNNSVITSTTPTQSPSPRASQYPPPPPIMPVSLPTSVAIPNPSLHESQVFSPYSPFFNPHHGPHGPHGGSHAPPTAAQIHHMKMSSSPPGLGSIMDARESPPLPHPPTMLHPALLAAAHHGNSPDYSAHLRAAMDAQDRNSDCNSAEMQFDGIQPTISFLKQQIIKSDSLTPLHSSTLTPMHLRKAKLMFFWVRYPSSAVLKMYFPDIKFNKNNTAQLVKWFSNFREFYYIQMEKYARQAVTEGIKNGDDLHVGGDSELYRVLNLHYNRNNHIEVPSNFRFVVEQTLREFFRAIQGGKDTEQSWKKSIYKIISRMDDPVPEYFKSPNFLEQLE